MTKYILHGGFTGTENELNRTFYAECTKGLKDGASLLFAYFAREEEDVPRLFEEDKHKILETTGVKNLKMILAAKEKFMEQVKTADMICIRGGDTEKLLDTLKQFPQFASELKGKIIVGSSAGAYILAQYYHSCTRGGVYKGLGILPIRVICHYKSEILPSPDDPMEAIENYKRDLDLIVLKDFEWKVIER